MRLAELLLDTQQVQPGRRSGRGTEGATSRLGAKALLLQIEKPRCPLDVSQRFRDLHVGPLEHLTADQRPAKLPDQFLQVAHDDYCYCRDVLLNIPTKLGKPLGDLAVKKFTAALVQRIVDRIADEGTPSKAAHALRYLRRMLQWGRNRGFLEVNPALGIEAPIERKQPRLPRHNVMDVLIDRATARGRLARNEPGSCPEYLSTVMELAYLCRLRGIEVVTLTDANELEEGILTNRRKGSRDNIVRWTPRLRAVWDAAKAFRART